MPRPPAKIIGGCAEDAPPFENPTEKITKNIVHRPQPLYKLFFYNKEVVKQVKDHIIAISDNQIPENSPASFFQRRFKLTPSKAQWIHAPSNNKREFSDKYSLEWTENHEIEPNYEHMALRLSSVIDEYYEVIDFLNSAQDKDLSDPFYPSMPICLYGKIARNEDVGVDSINLSSSDSSSLIKIDLGEHSDLNWFPSLSTHTTFVLGIIKKLTPEIRITAGAIMF